MDENFTRALRRTLAFEGGYTDGARHACDMPTNMGITQRTLDAFNVAHPCEKFPRNVRDLLAAQAAQIYHTMYWDNTRIPQIKHPRIQDAAFDINVMSGAAIMARTLQRAINRYGGAVAVDGVMGAQTVHAINAIPIAGVADFIAVLRVVRVESMRRMKNWATAQNGWRRRVAQY